MRIYAFVIFFLACPLLSQITIDGFFEDWESAPGVVVFGDSNYDSNGTELESKRDK